ncbi:MAG TPA: FtsQ-type POTRA domain-containing protein [Patescibacteria group bacterium]
MTNPFAGRERRSSGKKNNLTIEKFVYWVALLFFLGVTIYVLFLSHFLSITNIKIAGTEKIDSEAVERAVSASLTGNYLNILPKNNIILLKKDRIGRMLTDNFKLIEKLEIKKYFPDTLAISIKEKNPMLILSSGGQEYVIDDLGVAYEKADFESDFLRENKLLILEDGGGRKISTKEETLSPDYIKFILDVKDRLKNYLDIGTSQTVKTSNIASGDITMETDDGWKINLNAEVGADKEVEMLKVVLDNKIEKEKRGELEYVDLRINNKVYYKFKNPEQKSGN